MRPKPKTKHEENAVGTAVEKLKDARRFDDSKQYGTAVLLYEEGLTLLMERANAERDEPKKAVILKTVEEYMARAERCKRLAQAKPRDHDDYGAKPRPPKAQVRRPADRRPAARRRSPPPPPPAREHCA